MVTGTSTRAVAPALHKRYGKHHFSGLSKDLHGISSQGFSAYHREDPSGANNAVVFLVFMSLIAAILLGLGILCLYHYVIRPRLRRYKAKQDLERGSTPEEANQEPRGHESV